MHLRFTRLVFGLRPSPAILGAVLSNHIRHYCSDEPSLADQLKRSFYVDDLITGAPDVPTALKFCVQSRQVMAAAGMNLCKWNSNSSELLKKLNEVNQGPEMVVPTSGGDIQAPSVSILKPPDPASRILGVAWNSSMDAFYFDFTELGDSKPTEVTKRSILRLTARLFDPLGFVSPFVIQFKTLFRDLCSS